LADPHRLGGVVQLVFFGSFFLMGGWRDGSTGFAFCLYGSQPDSFLVPTVSTVLVIPFAWIFYRWIESPTHQIARNLARTLQAPPPRLPSPR
jgi:peptidoglycan/LPS O-acetylase OafA/YrhL